MNYPPIMTSQMQASRLAELDAAIAAIELWQEKEKADDAAFRDYMNGVEGRTRASLAASCRNRVRAADDANGEAWRSLPSDDQIRDRMYELEAAAPTGAYSSELDRYLPALKQIRTEIAEAPVTELAGCSS